MLDKNNKYRGFSFLSTFKKEQELEKNIEIWYNKYILNLKEESCMKRIQNLLIVILIIATLSITFAGCCEDTEELQHVATYELVSMKAESQVQVSGELSGAYVICFGKISGNLETTNTLVYKYCYKREDGGMIPTIIDMSSYDYPETVKVVIYEDNITTPKVEIWRDYHAQCHGDGKHDFNQTEFRFTVPSGSMVNTYDLQGLTE